MQLWHTTSLLWEVSSEITDMCATVLYAYTYAVSHPPRGRAWARRHGCATHATCFFIFCVASPGSLPHSDMPK